MKPKVTVDQILASFEKLKKRRINEFYNRFGDTHAVPLDFRREDIQRQVRLDHGVEYSDSGFRNRLKKLCEQGLLHKWRLDDHIVFYTKPELD